MPKFVTCHEISYTFEIPLMDLPMYIVSYPRVRYSNLCSIFIKFGTENATPIKIKIAWKKKLSSRL